MSAHGWMLLLVYLTTLLLLAAPVGAWLARVLDPAPAPGQHLTRVELACLRGCGVQVDDDFAWPRYALALILFNLLGAAVVFALQRVQALLPLNPQAFSAVAPDSALNTALAFVTNTDWQGYSGESTMATLTQMLALAVQNFLSAATGLAVMVVLIRGFRRSEAAGVGNAWVDLWRITVRVLLPLSVAFALVLTASGVVQTLRPNVEVHLLEPLTFQQPAVDAQGQPVLDAKGAPVLQNATTATQTVPLGLVASQEAIKLLGTNGGGYFNANSAHPFENPTPLTDFLQMLSIFLLPAAACLAFGRLVGDPRQGRALLAVMTLIFVTLAVVAIHSEETAHPALAALGVDVTASDLQAGGNLEGKELRLGAAHSALFATITTAASCGAVNAMHDALLPLGGLVTLVMMQFGEVVFGGVGSGLYGMLVFAVTTVFIAGLMIGRTPEYLGKKITAFEMKMVSLAILVTPLLVLLGTAVAVSTGSGRAGIANPGAHGFSEVLYAFTSAANNNGSAFGGLSANTPFYNVLLGVTMWFGRFAVIVPVLALAGALAARRRSAVHVGTLPTHGALFILLLTGTVVLVGLLNYVPALALGPVIEHLQLWRLQ